MWESSSSPSYFFFFFLNPFSIFFVVVVVLFFFFLQSNAGFTNLEHRISEPAGVSIKHDLPCRQSYSDIRKGKIIIIIIIKKQFHKLID